MATLRSKCPPHAPPRASPIVSQCQSAKRARLHACLRVPDRRRPMCDLRGPRRRRRHNRGACRGISRSAYKLSARRARARRTFLRRLSRGSGVILSLVLSMFLVSQLQSPHPVQGQLLPRTHGLLDIAMYVPGCCRWSILTQQGRRAGAVYCILLGTNVVLVRRRSCRLYAPHSASALEYPSLGAGCCNRRMYIHNSYPDGPGTCLLIHVAVLRVVILPTTWNHRR